MVTKVPKRKVKCNSCGREFYSAMPEDKLRCFCQSKDVSIIPQTEQELKEEEAPQEAPKPTTMEIGKTKLTKQIQLPKIISLSPKALAYVDRLVNEKGMFPDMNGCVNRAIEMLGVQIENPRYIDYIMQGGKINMQEEEPNPEKILKTMQVNDLIEAQIDKKKAEAKTLAEKIPKGEATKSDLLKVLQDQFEIKQLKSMMDNLEDSRGGGFKEIKEMMTMKWMMDMMTERGSHSHTENGETLELQKRIDELQRKIDKQDTLNEIKKIAENSKGQSMSTDDYLKLFADKHAAVEAQKLETEKARQEAQKEREEKYAAEREHQLEQVQGDIKTLEEKLEKAKEKGSGIGKISEIKEQIKELRDFAKEFGDQAKDKSTGEIAAELILGVAEKLREPISHAAKGFADKHAAERLRAQGQPVYNPGPQPTIQPITLPETTTDAPFVQPNIQPTILPETAENIVDTFASQNTKK